MRQIYRVQKLFISFFCLIADRGIVYILIQNNVGCLTIFSYYKVMDKILLYESVG